MTIALATTESVRGSAGTAGAIAYTISGAEINAAGVDYKILAQGLLPNVGTALYTATGVKAIVKQISLFNTNAVGIAVTMFVNGAAAQNSLWSGLIPANGKATFDADGWAIYDANGYQQYVGATGPQGIQGIQGIQGNQGIPGTPGVITTVTAGNGLTGGGSASTVSLDVNPDGASIEVVADQVRLKTDGTLNTHLAPMPTMTLKGNITGATAGPTDLSVAQATSMLNVATIALKGLMSNTDKIKINGLWIGAVADLGLDNTGANAASNTTKLQAAMDDATFAGGGVCYFPPGTYAFNATIVVSKAVIFMGRGRSITNLRMDHAQYTQFAFAPGAQGAGFEQLRLTGNGNTFRNAPSTKTTIAAGSGGVVLPITGGVLNLTSAAGLPTTGVIHFEARFPATTGTPYWGSATYTGITGNQLTGVTSNPTANGRTILAGDRAQAGGFAVDFGDIPNTYMQQCDILFHKSGIRSGGALQFVDDVNIREMNNVNNSTGEADSSECILVDGAGDRYLRRVTTDNGDDWVWMAGIRVNQCSSCVISDSNIINMNWALDVRANGGLNTAIASVMAVNTFFDSSSIGCRLRTATANDTAQRIRFVQCWFSTMTKIQPTTGGHPAGGFGCSMESANANSIDFIGCDFFQNTVGIEAIAASDWAVRSSRIAGNSTAGIRTTAGATHRFTIADNFIGNGAGFGANGVGINIQAGAYDRYQILDNRGLDTNTTPGIIDNGTVTYVHYKNVNNNLGAGLLSGVQNTRSAVAIAAVAETALHSIRVAANTLHAGTSFRVYAGGLLSNTTAASTSIIRVRIGPTTLTGAIVASWSVVMGTVARTNNPFFLEAVFTLPAIGTAIGQILITGTFSTALAAATTAVVAPVVINAAVDNFIEVTVTSGAATTSWNFHASALECLAI